MPSESQRGSHPRAPDNATLKKGATIGRYIVLGLVGRGGMGEVYAAYDPELDRKVALKLLRSREGHSAGGGRSRLQREAQAIARLSHPNVVVVHDVGTHDKSVFIAMEFVDGNTLGYWMQAGKRPWREVLEVFAAAGRGLVAAHEAGLVHRDFKPENVMLTKNGQVRVMDFGLARELGDAEPSPPLEAALAAPAANGNGAATLDPAADPDATAKVGQDHVRASSAGSYLQVKITQTGAMIGTPAYMAPEQFAGVRGDARADQFSFCVALYEALYGRRPFAGDTPGALMANVMAGKFTDPPADSRVPGWIRRILLRGLSTAREQRFPSMADLLAALARDPAQRRRKWSAAAGVVILLVVAVGGVRRLSAGQRATCAGGPARAASVWDTGVRHNVERAFSATGNRHAAQVFASAAALIDQYMSRWTSMYGETCQATHVRGEQSADVLDLRMGCLDERLAGVRALADVFTSADTSVVENAVAAAGALPTLDRCADVAMLRAVIKPPDDPAARKKVADLREDVAKIGALASAGRCEQAKKVAGPMQQAARELGYAPLQAEISLALGRLFDTCLDLSEALGDLEDAVMSAEASRHDEVAIQAAGLLAMAASNRANDVRYGRHWVRLGEAILARFPDHPRLEAQVATARGMVLMAEGRFDEALREQQRALAINRSLLGDSSIDVAMMANNVAITLHELGRDAEALQNIRQALPIFARVLGEDSGRFAVASVNETEILTALGRYDEAEAALDKAQRVWKQDGSDFFIGYAMLRRGELLLARHSPRAAIPLLEKAVALIGGQHQHLAAEAGFSLARAIGTATPAIRSRAVELADDAHRVLSKDPGSRRLVRGIEEWRRDHQGL